MPSISLMNKDIMLFDFYVACDHHFKCDMCLFKRATSENGDLERKCLIDSIIRYQKIYD